MKPHTTTPEQQFRWKKQLEKSGTFFAVLVLNTLLFLLFGTMVILHFVPAEKQDPMTFAKIQKPPPKPPLPPAHGGEAAKQNLDPTAVVVPPTSASAVLTTVNPTVSFSMPSMQMPAMSLPSLSAPSGSGLGQGTTGGGMTHTNPFGDALQDGTPPAFVGYFYDLKQTADDPPQPTGINQQGWRKEMLKLVGAGLNDDSLAKFLKGKEARNASGFVIPEQASENAPQAFNLQNVQPSLWAIVYHAKAIAPETGRYRFVGFGDDVLYVKMNGGAVFDGGWQFLTNDATLHQTYPLEWTTTSADQSRLRLGKWFDVIQGDQINLDVVIGDWGGRTGFVLMIQKDGKDYTMAKDGQTPVLPLFQLGSKLPLPTNAELPPISESDQVWGVPGN